MTHSRQSYGFLYPIQTHWADNDMYGHVNNVTYYSFFDTAANAFLMQHTGFDPKISESIGVVLRSECQFHSELSYPEIIEVGVSIAKLGQSSLQYELAIFRQGHELAAATGQFTHVFVNRKTRKSTPISDEMRCVLSRFFPSN